MFENDRARRVFATVSQLAGYRSAVMGILARQPGTSFNAALRSSPDYLGHYKKLPID